MGLWRGRRERRADPTTTPPEAKQQQRSPITTTTTSTATTATKDERHHRSEKGCCSPAAVVEPCGGGEVKAVTVSRPDQGHLQRAGVVAAPGGPSVMCSSPNWGQLPALAITNVFQHLDHPDRLNASTVCWHWRSVIFQPRFFKRIQFDVAREQNKKNSFFLQKLAHIVSEAKVTFDSCNLYDVELTAEILYKLSKSARLLSLSILPKYATLVTPGRFYSEEEWNYILKLFVQPLIALLSRKNPPLRALDLGCSEILALHASDFLTLTAKPQHLERLAFATVKQDPGHYPLGLIEPPLLEKCTALRVLSLDYDSLCDEVLQTLQLLPLRQLIVHVHGIDEDHFGLSEEAWASFRSKNPETELHLTLVCAYEAVEILHTHILRPSMPLTHLKVLFCEKINCEALEYLSRFHNETLRSLIWVDSMRIEEYRNIMELVMHTEQDPLVMMAWRCKKLQELIVHGYVLDPHNVVGVARLRGRELQVLEVSGIHLSIPSVMVSPFIEEISAQLGRKWCPLDAKTLPPALRFYPVSDEVRDQYILKYIRKDIME
ncbi:F-box only protein 33 [Anopheles arabiensis]|uniref:F-box only protein 33 n=1 Tax=Anopheles arabiensis TaxID=7173 RepID=UPI001AADBC9C|nr:F-box only protein 33 [Anopheles arabiensis]